MRSFTDGEPTDTMKLRMAFTLKLLEPSSGRWWGGPEDLARAAYEAGWDDAVTEMESKAGAADDGRTD